MTRRTLVIAALAGSTLLGGCAMFKAAQRPPADVNVERTPERIKRGEYLANKVMNCMECHTGADAVTHAPKPELFGMGGKYFGPEMGLPGKIYSPNLTSDPKTGLGSWTDGEILRAMREGVSKDGHALFPLMPYMNYRTMSDEDAYSIVAYLRTLEPKENRVPARELDFPLSVIVNTIPKPLDGPVPPAPTEQVAYGQYLFTQASCTDCHTPSEKGQPIKEKFAAGGMEFKMGDHVLRAPNITPDPETGIGKWTDAQIKTALQTGMRPDGRTLSPIMPWQYYNGLETKDVDALVAYMKTIKPVKNAIAR
jgi:mono/diheme cytochrome c family protein